MAAFSRFVGIPEALDAIRPLGATFQQKVILQMSVIAHSEAQAGAARHNKTGALVASLFNRAIPQGREVGHDPQRAPHAAFVHFGTRPHVITPKKGKALRWSTGGGFAFAKKVNHPGYRGDPYVYNAADAAVRQFDAIVNKSFTEATR